MFLFLCTNLFQKSGHYSRGTLFKEIRYAKVGHFLVSASIINAWSDHQKILLGLSTINQINIFFILYISAHQKSWPCIWRIQVNKDTFSTFPMNSLLKYMTPSWKQVWFLILNLEAAFFIEIMSTLQKFGIYFNF